MDGDRIARSTGRRGVLKRGLLLAAGSLGLGAAIRHGGDVQAAERPTTNSAQSLTVHGRGWHYYGTDHEYGDHPLRGERVATSGELVDGAGALVGEFHATVISITSPFSPGALPATFL